MGAMCQSEEVRLEKEQNKKKSEAKQRQYKQQLNNGVYAEKIRKYVQLFGRPVDEETKKFVNQNYGYNYTCEIWPVGYPRQGQLKISNKFDLVEKFKTANQNRTFITNLSFISLSGKTINYTLNVGRTNYSCRATFDSDDKFYEVIYREQEKSKPLYMPPLPPSKPTETYQPLDAGNQSYQKPYDWGAHYAAEVAKSNQQFRENMNKQAQEWNNYQAQKAQRGW